MRLEGKVALMSGVGPGMGRAAAYLWAQEGVKAGVVARREEHLTETVSTMQSLGAEATALVGDVAVKADAERVVQEVLNRYGRIDILYSGGGGFYDPTKDFSDIDAPFWQQAIGNNLDGIFNLSQAVRPAMKEHGGGTIVLIAASFNVRQDGNPAYGAAKAGLIGFAQSLSKEFYEDNIRVNVVSPGLIRGTPEGTPVVPAERSLSRVGFAQDIGYAALYFASDESSWVNGQVLSVDGGVDVGARPLRIP